MSVGLLVVSGTSPPGPSNGADRHHQNHRIYLKNREIKCRTYHGSLVTFSTLFQTIQSAACAINKTNTISFIAGCSTAYRNVAIASPQQGQLTHMTRMTGTRNVHLMSFVRSIQHL